MATFGKIGEKARGLVTAAGLGLSTATLGATAVTAQEVQAITETSFSSMWAANQYAQSHGMVLARAFNGEMRFVSPEIAQLLDTQWFDYGRDGILRGWTQENLLASLIASLGGDGVNFKEASEHLGANSTPITVQGAQGGQWEAPDLDPGGGDDSGTDTF